jgi:hypothetical protein
MTTDDTAANNTPLTGELLREFLDRLEADLEEGGSGKAIDLRARLAAQPLRADSLEAIGRLHALWMRADDAAAARAVIETDGAALISGLSGGEKANTAAHLARFRLQIAEHQDEPEAMRAALSVLSALVKAPGLDAEALAEYDIFTRLCGSPHLDVALEAAKFCHALDQMTPGRETYRAWDEAVFHSRIANGQARHGDKEKSAAAARQAVAALKTAAAGQDVDVDDWLALGNAVIEIAPDSLEDFQAAIAAFIADWPLPRRREAEVRLARLKARAIHAQGDLEGALAACEDARYSQNPWGTGADDFIEYELPWLLAAGKIEKAGERAFMAIYDVQCLENGLEESVYRVVQERLADPADTSVWWPLCVMRACAFHRTLRELLAFAPDEAAPLQRALFGDFLEADPESIKEETDLDPVFRAAQSLAEERAPGHVWIRRLAAVQDFDVGRIDAPAYLREIEAVIANGLDDCRTVRAHYEARLAALGIMETLKCPLPTFPCGAWAYRGAGIPEDIEEEAGDLGESEQEAIQRWNADFERAAYEQGRAAMERYFETGKGHPYDASVHLYSMLCNNLAIRYRFDDRPQEALELHRRGIAASSFAEHYDGILSCHVNLDDNANIVKAAEDLWHYAAENGYSRFSPEKCAWFSADALYNLERARDIPIWLERLTQWERENDFDEDDLPEDHLYARLNILFRMAAIDDYKEMVEDMWRHIEAQVRKSESGKLDAIAADLMRWLERWEDALYFYGRFDAIRGLPGKGKEYVAFCRQKLAKKNAPPAKPWWKVWK